LDALWRSRGVAPNALIGHSLGEFAAACSGNGGLPLFDYHGTFDVEDGGDEDDEGRLARLGRKIVARRERAGPLTRREAAQCVLARATLMANEPATGCMMSVLESEKDCLAAIDAVAEEKGDSFGVATVAAANTPSSTVLSGDYAAVSLVVRQLEKRNKEAGRADPKVKARKVRTTHADHSVRMDAVASKLATKIDAILEQSSRDLEKIGAAGCATLPMMSTVTGQRVDPKALRGGEYWSRHATGAVRFVDAMRELAKTEKWCIFVDIGDGMLEGFGKETLATVSDATFRWTPAISRKGEADADHFEHAFAEVSKWLAEVPELPKPKRTSAGPRVFPVAHGSSGGGKSLVLCKVQPPPDVLIENPTKTSTGAYDRTFTVKMPRSASLKHLIHYLERKYTMRLDVFDALLLSELSKKEKPAPMRDDDDYYDAVERAHGKEMTACYFVVRPQLDKDKKPLPPRSECREKIARERKDAPASFEREASSSHIDSGFLDKNITKEVGTRRASGEETREGRRRPEDIGETREDLRRSIDEVVDRASGLLKELIGEYDPQLGRRLLEGGHVCAEFEPFPEMEVDGVEANLEEEQLVVAQRALLAAIPKPSSLPEREFPATSTGGRCMDKWGYRWGQRDTDLWLYMLLPAGFDATDLDVKFHTGRVGLFFRDVPLYDGALWNTEERKGIDVDASAWVVVEHGESLVLHVEMHKKTPGWWKAVWKGHPTIEPWEAPDWKATTFGDSSV